MEIGSILAAKAEVAISKAEDRSLCHNGSDVIALSSAAHEYMVYMSELEKLPEIRADLVQKLREQMGSKVQYPPMIILDGVAILVGRGNIIS